MADGSQIYDVLGALTLGGLLGTIGQGLRAVAGLKKMNDAALASDVSAADLFSAARIAVSLMIGFVAGVATTLFLGPSKLINVDPADSTQILLGVIVAGYVGCDVIEAFTQNLSKVPIPKAEPLTFERPRQLRIANYPLALPRPQDLERSASVEGPVSTFGGPDDRGVGPDEGLALMNDSDIRKYSGLFLPQPPPGATGLARRLNPDASYIACRWDYDQTPKRYLKEIKVLVTNPETGDAELAQPVDWGPKESTGRVADLSPGLAQRLHLSTDQKCIVSIPLPEVAEFEALREGRAVHLKVLSESEIKANFGDFDFRESLPRGAIQIIGSWPNDNLTTIKVDELRHLVKNGEIECHKAIANHLLAAIKEVDRRKLIDCMLSWDGCWVPRHKSWNPKRSLSAHSWGIAFDINARWNAYGADPAPKGAMGSVVDLVPIFEDFGFAWGGFFRPNSARDGMHFEYCRHVDLDKINIS